MKTLVIGTGNTIYGDDGIAASIIKELEKSPLPQAVTVVCIGTNSFLLLSQDLDKYDRIIVVDSICSGGQAGNLYFIPAKELRPGPRPYSIHDITWYEVLNSGGFLPKTCLFAVEIDALNMGEELSPFLQGKIGYYAVKLYEFLGYTAQI